MGRTLLLAHPGATWREWLKENRKGRDWICLDPNDPAQSPPARLALFRGERPVASRFYGSLDAARAPHVLLAALAQLLGQAGEDAIVQLAPYRPTPLMRQVVTLAAQMVQPDEILIAEGTPIDQGGFPVGPVEVSLEASFPELVQGAQRKAQWLSLLENCREHQVDLGRIAIEGVRLGSGSRIQPADLVGLGLQEALHVEVGGTTLLIVAGTEPDEEAVAKALTLYHCSRAAFVAPDAYDDLLCSFARQNGEDFGLGMVRSIDFEAGRATIVNTAETPAPVRILRIGSMRVDAAGRELGETKLWLV